jgi:hypothetical protein
LANIPLAMPQYAFYFRNSNKRVKYPRSLNLLGIEAAHGVALKLARALIEASPFWTALPAETRNTFIVEIVDEAGETVLAVPFTEAEGPLS